VSGADAGAGDRTPPARARMPAAHEILLDAHVHFHPGFALDPFLDAAYDNLRRGGEQLGVADSFTGGLMLTESHGAAAFAGWRAAAGDAPAGRAPTGGHAAAGRPLAGREAPQPLDPAAGGAAPAGHPPAGAPSGAWRFERTAEANSLWAAPERRPGARLLLVAGRQLVTREGLEVLGLGLGEDLGEGLALDAAVAAVLERGAVPVVPWGFGKWWSRRGRRVAALLRSGAAGRFFLGDTAGRPRGFPPPRLFAEAARHGVFVLPGSDPLPSPRQATKAGRCGFALRGELDPERPAAAIVAQLRGCHRQPDTFGRHAGPLDFVRDQLAMQVRKRLGAGDATAPGPDPATGGGPP